MNSGISMFHIPQDTHEQSNRRNRIRFCPALFKLNSVFHVSGCYNDDAQLIPLYSYSDVSKARERHWPTFVFKC